MMKPLIATDVAGCREIVHNGRNGWLVEPHNHDSLVAALGECLATSLVDLQIMGGIGRAHVCKHYPIEAVHQVYLETLDRHLQNKVSQIIAPKPKTPAFQFPAQSNSYAYRNDRSNQVSKRSKILRDVFPYIKGGINLTGRRSCQFLAQSRNK